MSVEVKRVCERTNKLIFDVTVSTDNNQMFNYISPNYVCGTNYFQFNTNTIYCKSGVYEHYIFVKFRKILQEDTINYVYNVSSKKFNTVNLTFSDENNWHQYCRHTDSRSVFQFDMTAIIDLAPGVNLFAALYCDTELTDFDLHCKDGTVSVHKALIAGVSPVFYKMLCGNWKETNEGRVDIPETSILTLNHLKDYMYLQSLPKEGLEKLIILGSCYMMPDLVQKCCVKLINKLSVDNLMEIIEFAVKFKVHKLHFIILKLIQDNVLDVDKIPLNWSEVGKETMSTTENLK